MSPNHERLAVLGAITASILAAFCIGLPAEEDAFIYGRFALHAASGRGLAFNPGNPVEGFSSPLWMGLVTLTTFARVPPPLAMRCLGLLAGALASWATWKLARAARLGPGARVAAVVTSSFAYWTLVWNQSGLETPLYSATLLLAPVALFHSFDAPSRRAGFGLGIACGLLALSRPEGPGAAGLLLLWALWRGRRSGATRRVALQAIAVTSLVFGAYLVWRLSYFDALTPNTSVKVYPLHVERSIPQGLGYFGYLGWILPLLPFVYVWRDRSGGGRLARLALFGCIVSVGFHLIVGGDYRGGFRYLVPAAPLLVVAGFGAAARWLARLSWPRSARAAVLVGLVLTAVPGSWRDFRRDRSRAPDLATALERWRDPFADRTQWGVATALWVVDLAPPGSTVLFGQMGKTPYWAAAIGHDIRFIDTVGWVSHEIAEIYRMDRKLAEFARALRGGATLRQALVEGRTARAARFVERVLDAEPDYILIEPLPHAGVKALRRDSRFHARCREIEGVGDVDAWKCGESLDSAR